MSFRTSMVGFKNLPSPTANVKKMIHDDVYKKHDDSSDEEAQ